MAERLRLLSLLLCNAQAAATPVAAVELHVGGRLPRRTRRPGRCGLLPRSVGRRARQAQMHVVRAAYGCGRQGHGAADDAADTLQQVIDTLAGYK